MAFWRSKRTEITGQGPTEAEDTNEEASQELDGEGLGRPGPTDSGGRPVPEGYLDLGALYVPRIQGMQLRGQVKPDKESLSEVTLVLGSSGVTVSIAAAPKSGNVWPGLAAQIEAGIQAAGGVADEVEGPYGMQIEARVAATAANGKTVLIQQVMIGHEGPRWLALTTIRGGAAQGDKEQLEACLELIDKLIVVRGPEPRIKLEQIPLHLPKEAMQLNATK